MSKRLNYLDALRGFAVLGVIAIHSAQYSKPLPPTFNVLVQQGQYGVQLFYIISAFTLFLSLSSRGLTESKSLQNFFVRRLFRIAPLFWCAMIFYLMRDGLGPRFWLGDAPGISISNIIATATFTNGWNPYWINSIVPGGWSVAVEMMFYLTVPFLYKKIRSIRAATIFTCSTLLLSLLLSKLGSVVIPISDRELWRNFLYLALPSQMPVFGLGFILFFFSHHLDKLMPTLQNQKEALLLSRKFMSLLLLTFSILFCIFLTYGNLRIPVHFLYGIAFVILTMALQIYPWCLFVNPLTEYVGKISYSAYLTHFSILPLAKKIPEIVWLREDCNALPVYLLTFGITLGGTIIISSITYRLIEVPGQSLGRRLILIHN